MRRVLYSFILFFILTGSIYGQEKAIDIDWGKKKIAPGLIWKSAHSDSLFGNAQHINILEINPKKRKIVIIYNPEENDLTSQQGSQAGAIAAVNAGFFDVKNGGSVTYIKVDSYFLMNVFTEYTHENSHCSR